LIDYDTKGMPQHVIDQVGKAGGPWEYIRKVVPALEGIEHVVRASTSAGLYNMDTGEEIAGSDGLHIYVLIKDSSDTPRFLDNLYDRLWLSGVGWHRVGKTGQLLERAIVDRFVSGSERLVFEGPPSLDPPLAQHPERRRPIPYAGTALDSRVALPDLDTGERALLDKLRSESARTLGKEAKVARRKYEASYAAKLVREHNIPPATAQRLASRVHHHVLLPYHELEFDDGVRASVGDVLADADDYIGLTLADPIEGSSYGRCKAMIMMGDDGLLIIHSFAHGRTFYRLCYDRQHALVALRRAHNMDDVCLINAMSDLEADEQDMFVRAIADQLKLTQPVVKKRLKDYQGQLSRRQRQSAQLKKPSDRVILAAPPPHGALSDHVHRLDAILADVPGSSPPMRNVDGRLVEVRLTVPEGLHNVAAGGEADAQATIRALSPTGIEMLVEKYVSHASEKGYEASLPPPFIDALDELADTGIPTIRAINTAPIVRLDGTLIDGDGLDRDSGLYHVIDPLLRQCVPQVTPTNEDVRAALRFICDEWLVDVATDFSGKLTIVLLSLTLIQRALLEARPAFFVVAGRAKAGKTTVAQMCSVAIFGTAAPGANWSDSEEERRKTLFSFYRQGIPCVLWDNIKRGAAICCPHIERSLTEHKMSDRVLGNSQFETVPTNTVQIFTGNRITPKADMSSRSLTIMLDANRPDPEEREFKHADPLAWTRSNRPKILQALYTILLAGVHCHSDVIPKTRFKTWWKLVGAPVEHAAELWGCTFDCATLFHAGEAEDVEDLAVGEFLTVCRKKYSAESFQARDIAQALPGDVALSTGNDEAHALYEALSELAGKALERTTAHAISKILQAHVVDRTVWLANGSTATLRKQEDHEANSYWVQIGGEANDHAEPRSQDSKERKTWRPRKNARLLDQLLAPDRGFDPSQGAGATSRAQYDVEAPIVTLGDDGKRRCSCSRYRQQGSCRHIRSRRLVPKKS
jgi:hypothetical protein